MSFRPDGFEQYSTSNYMRFDEGANKIRILKEPISGWEYWEDASGNIVPRGVMGGAGAKPIRMRPQGDFSQEQISAMKMFAAMPVYNYNLKAVQILEVTQSSILTSLDALLDSPSWGDVTGYDIIITRKGEKLDTEYSVMPEPKAELSKEVLEAYDAKPINLEALYDSDDPFQTDEDVDVEEVAKAIDA